MNLPAIPERVLPWLLRLAWVGVLVVGWPAIDGATTERSEAVRVLTRAGGGALWLAGVAAMVVPAVVSLTATRVVVPLAVPAGLATWFGGADPIDASLLLVVAAATLLIAFTAEIGRVFVQASAYGEEDRHLLRSPAAYALASVLAWAMWATVVLAGPLLLAARQWLPGVIVTGAAVVGTAWLWPRWHRLARRWLVFVPVGLVIHDPLVLAETLMLRRAAIVRLHLAPAGTEAADLTGPAAGHALEILTTEPITAIRAATPSARTGTAIHLTACLVSPTRPGTALAAAGARRLPVG